MAVVGEKRNENGRGGGGARLAAVERRKKKVGGSCLCFLGFLFFLCIFSCFKINPALKKSV